MANARPYNHLWAIHSPEKASLPAKPGAQRALFSWAGPVGANTTLSAQKRGRWRAWRSCRLMPSPFPPYQWPSCAGWRGKRVPSARRNVSVWNPLRQWEPLVVRWPFCCICLLPLVAVRFAGERYGEAVEAARRLVEPPQMRLPLELETALVRCISARDDGEPGSATDYLGQTLRLAEQLNFL